MPKDEASDLIPELEDTRLHYTTAVQIASILQQGRSAPELLPQLVEALSKLVPTDSVEIAMMGSALRCEVPSERVQELQQEEIPEKPTIEGGRASIALSVGGRAFGALHLRRSPPFTRLELETLIDMGLIISVGLWSRFVQPPTEGRNPVIW